MTATNENLAGGGTPSEVETDLFTEVDRRRNYTSPPPLATAKSGGQRDKPTSGATSIRALAGSGDHARERVFHGRVAWTLNELVMAGAAGLTAIERPAPRWSDYVFKLRRLGVDVETITEAHGGPYSGHHARYVLRTPVVVLARDEV